MVWEGENARDLQRMAVEGAGNEGRVRQNSVLHAPNARSSLYACALHVDTEQNRVGEVLEVAPVHNRQHIAAVEA